MEQTSLKIALDFDGTYTEAPWVWDRFIDDCRRKDIIVYIVTFRPPDCVDPAMVHLWDTKGVKTYFTNAIPKKKYMESQGIEINIWIDDNPDLIVTESDWTPADRLQWKKDNGYAEESLFDRLIEKPGDPTDFEVLEIVSGS